MRRLAFWFVAGAALVGCNKPEAEDCRKALLNMQHLMGTENLNTADTLEGDVRRCRGGSSKESVACAIKATTLLELRQCEFYKSGKGSSGSGTTP
jgi:hypothetical protein